MARPDPYLPDPGNPRRFYAMAMPNGDARLGIAGHLVFLKEQRVGLKEPGTILTRAEAEALRDELGRALRAFDLAKEMAREVACEVGASSSASSSAALGQQGNASSSAAVGHESDVRPRAYLGPYPIRGQGTLADCPPPAAPSFVTGNDRR